MQPDLTLIIPTKNSQATILRCFDSIRSQRDCTIQLIVIDNFSQDRTTEMAASATNQVFLGGPARSDQCIIGLSKATGRNVGFIDSTMVLTPYVCSQAIEQLEQRGKGGVIIPELPIREEYVANRRLLEEQILTRNQKAEVARIFPTELVRSLGGFDSPIGDKDWNVGSHLEGRGWILGRTQAVMYQDQNATSEKLSA